MVCFICILYLSVGIYFFDSWEKHDLYNDFNGNGQFDSAVLYETGNLDLEDYQINIVTVGETTDNKSIKQEVWDITVDNDNIDAVIHQFFNNEITLNYLEDLWDGDKPKDNIVIGTDFKMIFKIENLKLMRGTYDVKISNKGLGHFKNTNKELEYWIATEQTT